MTNYNRGLENKSGAMKGILYGVGIGPGDPELLTLKAVKTIKACDVIALPAKDRASCIAYQIASGAVELGDKEQLFIPMPMTKDKVLLERAHQDGARRIQQLLEQGKSVAFLVLGDPSIYATYTYVHRIIKASGYETVIIPGVPSFCAVAARLNEPLAEQAEQLHVIPASYQTSSAVLLPGTKVFLKAGSKMSELKQALLKTDQEAMMVENCGMKNEKVYTNTADMNESASYYSIVVVK